jgi:multidrug efflux pump subunit AcrA (membrane-fusion protein)
MTADLRRRLARQGVPVLAVVLVVGGSAAAWAATTGGSASPYRTAVASKGSVVRSFEASGTVSAVNQTTATFPVSEKVASIAVSVGSVVHSGQILARLDTTQLTASVVERQAALAKARATVESDTAASATTPATTSGGNAVGVQRAVQKDVRAVTRAFAVQKEVCASALSGGVARSSAPAPDGSASPRAALSPSPTASPVGRGPDALARCLEVMQQTFALQKRLAADEAALAALGRSSISTTARASSTAGQSQSAVGRLGIDEAAVVSSEEALATAKVNLAAAVLRSPASGTVASVGLAAGSPAGSSGIVVVGTGAAKVTFNVPLATRRAVTVGQRATVTPDGSTASVQGTVAAIGILPAPTTASTGASTPSYPVDVLVPSARPALLSGSRVDVQLALATVEDAVTVPNSALTPTGSGTGVITVLSGGKASRLRVQTGVVGLLRTQVVSGLHVGAVVVLADDRQSLPASSTTVNRFGGGAGGLGGGARFRPVG